MSDLASCWRQAIDTSHRPDVHVSGQVLRHRAGIIAGEPFPCGVMDKTRTRSGWIINPRQPAHGGSQPKPPKTIYMERGDKSFGQTIGWREPSKSSPSVSRQTTSVEAEPKVARAILGKRCCRVVSWQTIGSTKSVKALI